MTLFWTIVAVLTVFIVVNGAFLWFILKKGGSSSKEKDEFNIFAADLFEKKFKDVVDMASGSFKEREERVSAIIKNMGEELKQHREYVQDVEKDRLKAYIELKEGISANSNLMDKLRSSTERLRRVLSSSQSRGQFGEKIAEDILKAGGLIEGVHYIKQKTQENVSTRPDFIFTLPDEHKLNMDVKFPLDNYARMIGVEDWEEKDNEEANKYRKAFEKDVKDKIAQISSRQYINPADGTLDFALMFIPNESIASFINQEFAGVFELAMKKGVQITSPYNLIAFVSMIQRASQNFYQKENIRGTLILLEEFVKRYNLFKERFEKIGENINKTNKVYEDIRDKSFKNIDSTIIKIEKNKESENFKEIQIEAPEATKEE